MKRVFFTFYLLLILSLILVPLGIKPLVKTLFEDEMVEAQRQLTRGTFYLIAREMAGLDGTEQHRALAQLKSRFGYPVAILSLEEIQVHPEDELDFLGGVSVWDRDRQRILLRLGNSRRAVAMGPFPGRDLINRAAIFFWGLCLICLIIPTLIWTWRVYRDVQKIQLKAGEFFGGNLAARARVAPWSSMTGVVRTVNTMADKAQKLIGYQKSFANAISHEIRTPLARIKFSLEMMDDGPDSPDAELKEGIGRDVAEIEDLVDEMLTYARFERDSAATVDLPVNDMVSWLKNLVAREEKAQVGKVLHLSNPLELETFSHAFEPTYLGWTVRNLIRNGLRHAKSRVEVILARDSERVTIHVEDDGPGVPEEMRDKIFIPFFRLDGSRNRNSGGYGLGLAIAGRIAAWHGGRIQVTETNGGGARFSLSLPLDGKGTPGQPLWDDLG